MEPHAAEVLREEADHPEAEAGPQEEAEVDLRAEVAEAAPEAAVEASVLDRGHSSCHTRDLRVSTF